MAGNNPLRTTQSFPNDKSESSVDAAPGSSGEKLSQTTQGFANESSSCAARAASDVDAFPCPERIGRYRVERILGKGGFGLVYLAFDEQLDRRVAVKVPHARLVSRAEDAEAYLTEARTVANLDHPNIVPVHDVGCTDEFPCFIVSRYVNGTDLATKLKHSRPAYCEAAELVATVAEALHYAHIRGVVHRDVKPGNILVDLDGQPYLVDFGLALREENIGRGSRYAGTPAYMSPEQARGEGHRVDGRSDIYSLGAVFYELLTGHRTYSGNSKSDLLDQIASLEPPPPTQLDEKVSQELERICLKALSLRASQRYATALGMAEDLRCFLAEHPAALGSTAPSAPGKQPASLSTDAPSDTDAVDSQAQLLRIVPKGLRAFDWHDADFFLALLPGARDREGLPDSLRFWKTRIEETDPDKTFSVGLIYGPSGCGKSSLVKAGLLPRLSDDVVKIYIDATPDKTEHQLLHRLQRSFPGLTGESGLKETLAALRRGEGITVGKKVLIVLDQFEQWLHVHRTLANSELVEALRQCDGENVQCLLMVRDDFWMAVTRFLGALEIDLIQGQNCRAVDLFTASHAREVLRAFGRAYGALPDDTESESADQKEFVEQAVAGLSEDGNVVCVRLALFAEMLKSRLWTPSVLDQVGGTTGVGETFLEETFSARTANPQHRLHEKAARAVLKALLPETGTDIKGEMKSCEELLQISGYSSRPKDFGALVRLLDAETRLITPTDQDGEQGNDEIATGETDARYYQLTHDHLVHSLRDWLTRKQKETRRGRAELRLAERSALWNSRPENRRLPAWWEYCNIRLLTDSKKWTEPQRKMMSHAWRILGIRWGSALVVALVVGITVQQVVSSARRRNLSEQVRTTVASLNSSRGIILPPLADLEEFPQAIVQDELSEQFEAADEVQKLPLVYALAHLGDVRVEYLVSRVKTLSPDEVGNIVTALLTSSAEAVSVLESAARAAENNENWRHKARLAMLALHLERPAMASSMCRFQANPVQRTLFIDECSTWHGDLSSLLPRIADSDDRPLRSAISLVVGSVQPAQITIAEMRQWETLLSRWHKSAGDSATHSASGWALRRWNLKLPKTTSVEQGVESRDWRINSVGITLLKIHPGSFIRKDIVDKDSVEQKVTLTRPFWLADREVSRAQFQQFMDDANYPETEKSQGLRSAWEGCPGSA